MSLKAEVRDAALAFLSSAAVDVSVEERASKLDSFCAAVNQYEWKAEELEELRKLFPAMRLSEGEIGQIERNMVMEAPAQDTGTSSSKRKKQQDFTRFYAFMSAQTWEYIFQGHTSRGKYERLSESLYQQLGLRLPSEPTYGMMVALVLALQKEEAASQWKMHVDLQEVKSVWTSVKSRMKQCVEEPAEWIKVLPETFDELPQEVRDRFQDEPIVPEQRMMVQKQLLLYLAAKVPLRGTHLAVASAHHALKQPMPQMPWQIMPQALPIQTGSLQNLVLWPGSQSSGRRRSEMPKDNETPCKKAKPLAICSGSQGQREPSSSPKQSADAALKAEQALVQALHAEEKKEEKPKEEEAKQSAEEVARTVEEALREKKRKSEEKGGTPEPKVSVVKRPSAKGSMKKPSAKISKTKDKQKKEASEPKGPIEFEAKIYGLCKAEFYREKSYIRNRDAQGSLRMIIGASGEHHKQLVQSLIPHVRLGKNRESLLNERAKIKEKL